MDEDLSAARDRLARVLAQAEEHTPAEGAARQRAIAEADRWRAAHGLPPLRDDPERPELEFHERARSLGLIS